MLIFNSLEINNATPNPFCKCLGVWVVDLGDYWQTPKKVEKWEKIKIYKNLYYI